VSAAKKAPAKTGAKPKSSRKAAGPKTAAGARRASAVAAKPGHSSRPKGFDPAAGRIAEAGHKELVRLADLHPAPWNPRKTFDEAAIAGLADSIAAQGLLQNLVVVPRRLADRSLAPTVGGYYVVAGERRLRALHELVLRNAWSKDAAIECRVVAGDGTTLRAMSILENLQRVDLTPLEEAEAFAELVALYPADAKPPATQVIADRIGKSQRYVQDRVQMAQTLSPAAKAAMAKGEINIVQARALVVAGKPAQQAKVLQEIEAYRRTDHYRASTIEDKAFAGLPRVGAELFPLADYTGGFHERKLPDYLGGKTERHFADAPLFWKLQKPAIEELAEKLRKKWAWVDVNRGDPSSFANQQRYKESKAKDAGAVVWVQGDGRVITHTRRARVDAKAEQSAEAKRHQAQIDRANAEREARQAAREKLHQDLTAKLTGLDALRLMVAELAGYNVVQAGHIPHPTLTVEEILALDFHGLAAALSKSLSEYWLQVADWQGQVSPIVGAIAKLAGVEIPAALTVAAEKPKPKPKAKAKPNGAAEAEAEAEQVVAA